MIRNVPQTFTPILLVLMIASSLHGARYDGMLTVNAADEKTGQAIPVRMELRNSHGKPVRVRPKGAIALDGYLVFDGSVTLELKKGNYQFFIEAGPEYQTRQGHFTIERHAEDSTEVLLTRRVNMQNEGWWAADLEVSQALNDMPLLMRAAGVDFVPVTVATNLRGKCSEMKLRAGESISDLSPPFFGPWAAIDYRRGGGLQLIASESPFPVCDKDADESSLTVSQSASDHGDKVIALSPFAWDLPIWIASGKLDAVQLIHRHSLLDNVIDNEDWGYPRNRKLYPGAMGNGRWSEAIYHHLLNCGLRIPPVAGSGSGTNGNPVGTNRVYAYCEGDFSREAFFDSLRAGQVMVTNGPLLRTKVEGNLPGHVFMLDSGQSREFQIALSLTFYEKAAVEYLEILKNGEVVHQIRLRDLAKNQGRLPPLKFDSSGWFAVRAMTGNTKNYQFATTGPYFVQTDYQPRVSRRSVQFFLDWLEAAEQEFAEKEAVIVEIAEARRFWTDLFDNANAD
ncbi:CehA/McbA family metallohydrolase domain-containing protein [Bythopirellula goksoeyrii]|uniref:Uncharacterized protein n=1 Tax=Bythopirellula goksoeyrii TaxID=1400387 RepID=A0A5B9Q5J9_9BACT|nr:hypothetical protein [Bythopirellula goksoeyrii]QEG34308.1 hypothetical protein Pr1d_15820 [Bythopirellula goksoeyrii]